MESHVKFFTATILEWKKLLKQDKYKEIVISSLRFLVKEERVKVYAFVIMENHIHLVWQMMNGHTEEKVQHSFLKYTAQQIKFDLKANHPQVLSHFYVGLKDRAYQFWERNPLSVDLYSEKVILQKIKYIHENPVRAGLVNSMLEWKYSSSAFYEINSNEWDFLCHYSDLSKI